MTRIRTQEKKVQRFLHVGHCRGGGGGGRCSPGIQFPGRFTTIATGSWAFQKHVHFGTLENVGWYIYLQVLK
jgi:hypothetical protein